MMDKVYANDVPMPVRELAVNEAAAQIAEAAAEATKASDSFIAARKAWIDARDRLDQLWAGYMAARDRQGLDRS